MSLLLAFAIAVIGGYLVGSIPAGYLIGRLKGIDVRAYGSGNVGATNVMRSLGFKFSILVFFLDVFKGFVPTLLAWLFLNEISPYVAPIAGLSAVAGHICPVWMRFRGGKGLATSSGMFAGLAPSAIWWSGLLGIYLVILFGGLYVTRYVSLAGLMACAMLLLATLIVFLLIGSDALPYLVVAVGAGILVTYSHRANIERLRRGEERTFTFRRNKPETHSDKK